MRRATKEEIANLDTGSLNLVINEIFDYWRTEGFPDYNLSPIERRLEWLKLKRDYNPIGMIDEEGVIKQTMHGLGLAWHYFPHHWDVRVNNKPTVIDIWNSDELFKKAIARRINRGGMSWDSKGNPRMTVSIIRKALMACSSAQRVSNFRPTAATALYDRYSGSGRVWDMSCGFGGRLLGAALCNNVTHYYGTEPSTPTFNGLQSLVQDLYKFNSNTHFEINKCGAEEYQTPEKVDFAFTSPPYFNTEMYSHEATQSAVKFPTVQSWNEEFLGAMIDNAYKSLKKDGILALNVANVKSHKTLEAETVEQAEKRGFVLTETLRLSLSAIVNGAFKYEPVFVFRKDNQ